MWRCAGYLSKIGRVACLTALLFVPGTTPASDAPAAATARKETPELAFQSYRANILPFLSEHCFDCHGNGKSKGDVSFEKFKDDLTVYADRKTWDDVQHVLETHEMPPAKRHQPKQAEIDGASASIRGLFERFDSNAAPNAGRVTIRRLNKTEYNNTIRDLVGVDFKPADDFPADDVGYGFDNIGDVLSVTPLLLEKYLSAAEQVLEQAIVIADPPKPTRSQIGAIRTNATSMKSELGGTISFDEGDYIIRCRVSGDQIGDEPVKVMVRVAGEDVKAFDVPASKERPITLETKLRMKQGTNRVTVAFLNPFALPAPEVAATQPATRPAIPATQPTTPATQPASRPTVADANPRGDGAARGNGRFRPPVPVSDGRTRILFLQGIEVEGPFNAPPPEPSAAQKRLMAHKDGVSPREAATEIITRFATRAYRRPVQPAEVAASLRMYDAAVAKGKRFEWGVRAALYRIMVSPNFLFRVELDPPGVREITSYPINDYELASRLSYFLWNSMPDDELFALAGKGQLRANLETQVRRMVNDPKSVSFLYGFAEQWLALRKLALASPDPRQFPGFDEELRESMIRESDLFFEAIVRENRSILDLLDADFTFVNERLARHYGMTGVKGGKFVRVKTPANRGGILTHAAILTLTSNATRTSPVKRGKFVLEQILNSPPPPPPPDVPALDEQKQLTGTLRQVLEQHRSNAMCASCHQRMDPIGFAFENFDPVGKWRDKDGSAAIDASGVLPDGKAINGPDGLKQLLRERKTPFVRCVAEKMLTYATGRGLEYYDRRSVDKIMTALGKDEYRFSTLLAEIVKSDPFQMRTTSGEKP